MPREPHWDFGSRSTNLKIAALVSRRPRTLNELAEETGISVQGVLKHLRRLEHDGVVEVKKVESGLGVRQVYRGKDLTVGDFSVGDLTIVRAALRKKVAESVKSPVDLLEYLSEDSLVQRRRVKESGRKLLRMIDDLDEGEARIRGVLDSITLKDSDRIILETFFAEETMEDAEKVLTRHFGLKNGRRSIEEALAEARRIARR